jgi:quercetin dioxygenase-like cupin family protein
MGTSFDEEIERELRQKGMTPHRWSNTAHTVYPVHEHPYAKVLFVVDGEITFQFPHQGRTVLLKPGDRLDIPAGTYHSAVVGPHGVACVEGHILP